MKGRVHVCWLFGLIAFLVSYQEKNVIMQCKVLGIDILKIIKNKKKKVPKVKKNRDKIEHTEDTKPSKTTEIKSVVETKKDKIKSKTEEKESKTDKSTILSIPSKIKGFLSKIRLTISNICDKINYWKNFLSDDRVKSSLVIVKTQLFKLFKHILPKKFKGQLTYGFDDPCSTGQVLAGISVVYPLYYKHLSITPDFTRQIFIGNIDFKGRIYIVYLIKCGLSILFNKNIQFIIHTFRNKEDSNNGK